MASSAGDSGGWGSSAFCVPLRPLGPDSCLAWSWAWPRLRPGMAFWQNLKAKKCGKIDGLRCVSSEFLVSFFLVSYVFCWKQCFSWEFIAAKIASSIGTYWNCIFGCWTRIFGWKMWVDLSSASSLKILPSNLKISTLTLLRVPSIKTFHLNIKS